MLNNTKAQKSNDQNKKVLNFGFGISLGFGAWILGFLDNV